MTVKALENVARALPPGKLSRQRREVTGSTSKTNARKLARERIQSLGKEGWRQASETISAHISRWNIFVDASRVLLFAALPGEPLLLDLLNSDKGRKFCFPKVEGEKLRLFEVAELSQLKPGRFGIPEPNDGLVEMEPGKVDLALIPGLAFGKNGERLGRGGGFFDRFLPRLSVDVSIAGVCFDCQIFDKIPMNEHDLSVHHLVSEGGILSF